VTGCGFRLEALGTSGAPAPGRLTTTFRLPGGVLVDTGAAAHGLEETEQEEIREILLSHAHLDHTLGLPFLLGVAPLRIVGLASTIQAVRRGLLDGHIWPDLGDRAAWHHVTVGEVLRMGPYEVTIGPASHTVPCLSAAFTGENGTCVIVGDTRPDDAVIEWAARCAPSLCVVEVSFPDAHAALAHRYGHQTPRDLVRWRAALGPDCALHVTHLKPAHRDAIRAECDALHDPRLHILQDGDVVG